jgi:hypothetical protein
MTTFIFARPKIILDWFHLKKKFADGYGMAFKGKEIRNEYLGQVRPLLWKENVDGAIGLMADADPKKIKNKDHLKNLTDYLDLRKELGLGNSSNKGEKASDLVVARRQNMTG